MKTPCLKPFRWPYWLGGVVVFFAVGWWGIRKFSAIPHIEQARSYVAKRQWAEAEKAARSIEPTSPEWLESRIIAGDAATRLKRPNDAIAYYESVPATSEKFGTIALFARAELYRVEGDLSGAVDCLRQLKDLQPENSRVYSRLAFLMGTTGQRWETIPNYRELLDLESWTPEELILMGDVERPLEQREYLQQCRRAYPDDPLVLLGLAAHTIADGEPDAAIAQLTPLVKKQPHLAAAQAHLGELLVSRSDYEFLSWTRSVPSEVDAYPDVWYARGLWLRRKDHLPEATRCFWETIRRAPVHRRATYQLGQVLLAMGNQRGAEFAERAGLQVELTQRLDSVLKTRGRNEAELQEIVRLLESMGRWRETVAWAHVANRKFPQSTWPIEHYRAVTPLLRDAGDGMVAIDHDLSIKHDLSHFPLPDWSRWSISATTEIPLTNSGEFRFEESAAQIGLKFTYNNGDTDLDRPGARMFEQTGGGVAVLDYDLDSWPDIYFTQGGKWLPDAAAPTPSLDSADQLFRNESGERFRNVTASLGVTDTSFGQGATSGDVNNDGFPDLYVANIGPNQLYENMGDGTFLKASPDAGPQLSDWTTSVLIADLNADGNPDLFDVNYVDGPGVFQILCQGYGCSPKHFQGIQDRFLLNGGNDTFTYVAEATPAQGSKGMGSVALSLGPGERLSLFVSNDQVPNHLLRNRDAQLPGGIRLENESFLCGVAYNDDGLAMAGMGIAAGDADGNGLTDFFVTNFRDESNTLYLQDAPGLFTDATRSAGLLEGGYPYVGWGTQFLDADLDGDEDIVLVNGHVDDYRSQGQGYQMPAQLYENDGHAHFTLIKPEHAGPFFSQLYLGRGLARLDWNADGRPDFVASVINSPAVLASNQTGQHGHFLNIRLHACNSARDALGAVVIVKAGEQSWQKQFVGGDGFMAHNEPVLQFGLGQHERIDQVTIEWPSGARTELRELPMDGTLCVVEQAKHATIWRQGRATAVLVP